MIPQFSIGPAAVPSYPLLVLIGFWIGMWLAAREANRLGLDGDDMYNIGLYGFIATVIGGRFWYVLTHWEAYVDVPMQALALTANAIAWGEGLVIGLVVVLIYIRRRQLPLPLVADAVAPGMLLALTIGAVGAFFGSYTLGTITKMPWGVTMFGLSRHPAHLYVAIAALSALVAVWFLRDKTPWPGFTFLLSVLLYATGRLVLDIFFAAPTIIGDGWRLVQISSFLVMLVTVIIMAVISMRHGEQDGQTT